MTNLTSLKPNTGSTTRRRRVARGVSSGLGGTCGRGMNWQNSRTGKGKRYPTFEGGQTRLFMRTPKRRGFTAYAPKEYVTVSIAQIEKLVGEGVTTIDYAILYERRMIREKWKLLKILGSGTLSTAVTVMADAYSVGAKASIEKVGGQANM